METVIGIQINSGKGLSVRTEVLRLFNKVALAAWVPDGMQRAARLRRLAGRLETAAPDLAAELYEDASILEDLAA